MSIDQVSDYLQIPVATLYRWRTNGEGPVACRVGRFLRYRETDVDQWLDNRASAVPQDRTA
jgi:excisionase family DNA binding protein